MTSRIRLKFNMIRTNIIIFKHINVHDLIDQ
jgi:hypothetical protein